MGEATILVTGATAGLGERVATELARKGATVLIHGRSRERLEASLQEIRMETGNEKLGSYLADLSSLGAVRALAEEISSERERLDVLINNAGVMAKERKESADGHELTFAVTTSSLLAHPFALSAAARVCPGPGGQCRLGRTEPHRLR